MWDIFVAGLAVLAQASRNPRREVGVLEPEPKSAPAPSSPHPLQPVLSMTLAQPVSQDAGLALLALGDWGGDGDDHPTTHDQIKVGHAMAAEQKKLSARGTLLLGDNFYYDGVTSNTSFRFQKTFEEVYPRSAFGDMQFHVIAGNHDHHGSANAQVQYRSSVNRWSFPSLYYNLSFSFATSDNARRTLDVVMTDTVLLTGLDNVYDGVGCSVQSKDVDVHQWRWLEQRLNESTADFLFVAGHYPIYSAGSDGTTKYLVKWLLPLLKKYGAHYISGHDHMMQHIVSDGVQMFLMGAGKECCYKASNYNTVKGEFKYLLSGHHGHGKHHGPKPAGNVTGGFASLRFDHNATVAFYDQDGETLYTADPIQPRQLA